MALFLCDREVESVTFADGTVVSGKNVTYYSGYSMKKLCFFNERWSNTLMNKELPHKEVASFVPKYYEKMAEHVVYEPSDRLYYGGLLVIFDKEYCRLASSEEFKGEFYKNPKGLVIFKADENGSKTLNIKISKRRGRFYNDEEIVKMEAESGYTSGFYKNWHWKIK